MPPHQRLFKVSQRTSSSPQMRLFKVSQSSTSFGPRMRVFKVTQAGPTTGARMRLRKVTQSAALSVILAGGERTIEPMTLIAVSITTSLPSPSQFYIEQQSGPVVTEFWDRSATQYYRSPGPEIDSDIVWVAGCVSGGVTYESAPFTHHVKHHSMHMIGTGGILIPVAWYPVDAIITPPA